MERERAKRDEKGRERVRERRESDVVRTCGPAAPRSILLVSKSRYGPECRYSSCSATNSRVRLTASVLGVALGKGKKKRKFSTTQKLTIRQHSLVYTMALLYSSAVAMDS